MINKVCKFIRKEAKLRGLDYKQLKKDYKQTKRNKK